MPDNPPNLKSAFNSQLVDASGQPNLIKNSSQLEQAFWNLLNNQTAALEITPLKVKVDENNYNFAFEFSPALFTKTPVMEGWEVYAQKDNDGRITDLYVAVSGKSLSIAPGDNNKATLIYSDADPKDPNLNEVDVSLTMGQNVALAGQPALPPTTFSFSVSLVQGNTPMSSAPPLSVDFVGRRTVVNDGHTDNEFSFALTNMTEGPLSLTPDVLFTVWFDAKPNQTNDAYPAALARVEDLTAKDFLLNAPGKWKVSPPILAAAEQVPGNPQWQFKVTENLALAPQDPIVFNFGKLRTPLDPGISRMYLQVDGLPGFPPFVLLARLEKTPLSYGPIHGQGLFVSAAGDLNRATPSDLTKESGLYVKQAGDGPAAIFNGGNVGIGTKTMPMAKLHILDSNQNLNGGSVIVGSTSGPTLRFGCDSTYAWIQSYSAPLAINAAPQPVGIGTTTPGSTLSVAGGVAIGKGFAQKGNVIGANELAVEGKIGIGVTTPGSSLSVDGGVAIGHDYVKGSTIGQNNLAVQGRIGVGITVPGSSLSVVGGVAIGSTYAQNDTQIAANNLAVEGKVGIGIKDPSNQLHVESADGIRFSLKNGGQLLIGANNDKSVQLVAAGPKGSGNASADFMYLGGAAAQVLPKMILNAKEVDIEAATTVLSGELQIKGKNVINLGSDVTKEVSAGRIGYEHWTVGALDIVGAGTKGGERNIVLWDNIYVPGNIWQFMQYNQKWMALWPSGSSTGAWYNFGPQTSDLSLKSNVAPVSGALDKIRNLSGVSFRWTENALARFTGDIEQTVSLGPGATIPQQEEAWQEERERRRKELEAPRLGVIAQDVEKVLPEAVTIDSDGFKAVHYDQLIALLIEAVKEQDKIVAKQQAEIDELKQALKGK